MTTPTKQQIEAAAEAMFRLQNLAEDQDFKDMAKAALTAATNVNEIGPGVIDPATIGYAYHLQRIDEVIAAEREACARVAERYLVSEPEYQMKAKVAVEIAAAIRARGKK